MTKIRYKLFIKRLIKILVIFFIFLAVCPSTARAETSDETEYVVDGIMDFETEEADRTAGNPYGYSIKGIAQSLISGEGISFASVLDKVLGGFFSDIKNQVSGIRKIIILIIACGVLKSISSSFGGKGVSDIGFYACYSVIIYIIMYLFIEEVNLVKENVSMFMKMNTAMVPVYVAVSAASERAISTAALSATIMAFSSAISGILSVVVIPVITAAAGLEMVNNMFEEDMFSSLSSFIKYILSLGLKLLGMAFVFVISFQRLGTSGVSSFTVKAAKNAVNCVPVVGDILASSAQTVADASSAVGNSVAAACAIVAGILSAAPILRLTAIFLIFKLTAAITEPAGEKRITKTLNSAGDYFAILIGAVFLSAAMFVFSAVILAASF